MPLWLALLFLSLVTLLKHYIFHRFTVTFWHKIGLYFIAGAAATYMRLIPKIKTRYDYGVMIFILTFNLVVVSGLRAETVMKLARERLSTIGMGFVVCIFTSLLIFPMWASDELHCSTASNFQKLASSIEGTFTIPVPVWTKHPLSLLISILT